MHQQRLDIGLVLEGEIKTSADKLIWQHIAASEIVLLVPPTHPMAKRREPLELAELCRLPLIVNEPRIGYMAGVSSRRFPSMISCRRSSPIATTLVSSNIWWCAGRRHRPCATHCCRARDRARSALGRADQSAATRIGSAVAPRRAAAAAAGAVPQQLHQGSDRAPARARSTAQRASVRARRPIGLTLSCSRDDRRVQRSGLDSAKASDVRRDATRRRAKK